MSTSEKDDLADDIRAAKRLLAKPHFKLRKRPDFAARRKRFNEDRARYNRGVRQDVAATYLEFATLVSEDNAEPYVAELRAGKGERAYGGGSAFSVILRINCGFPSDFSSVCGQILRWVLHRGLTLEELDAELTDDWNPRAEVNKARAYFRERGLAAPQHDASDDEAEAQSDTSGAAEASQESSDTYMSAGSGDPGTEFTRETSDHGTDTMEVENIGFNVQPKPGADASLKMGPTQSQELGVLEFDTQSGRQIFRPILPMEAIRLALDMLWSANGYKKRGHSSQVSSIIEAVLRLGRMSQA